jgi:hypothetical protein
MVKQVAMTNSHNCDSPSVAPRIWTPRDGKEEGTISSSAGKIRLTAAVMVASTPRVASSRAVWDELRRGRMIKR